MFCMILVIYLWNCGRVSTYDVVLKPIMSFLCHLCTYECYVIIDIMSLMYPSFLCYL